MFIRVVVDRIQHQHAVLISDAGSTVVRVRSLPDGITEGIMLKVPFDEEGAPVWEEAEIDEGKKKRHGGVTNDAMKGSGNGAPGSDRLT